VRLVDARASVLGLDDVLQFQVDPYVFLRESYRQSRLVQINDGASSTEAEEDPFEDALFGE
jgi:ABC-type transporter lipoprotein component MlaA